jgi:serine/threonine protein kinase
MERECRLWASLRHANIMPFYGYAYDRSHRFGVWGALISPVCSHLANERDADIRKWYRNGDANRYLNLHRNDLDINSLTNLVRFFMLRFLSLSLRNHYQWRGVIEGVSYLHRRQNPIVHGDLKPVRP